MNAQFEVHAEENFCLGNQSHLAPEVLAALAVKGKLRRGSEERVVFPLAGQDAFAAGVTLCVHLTLSVSVCTHSHSHSKSLPLRVRLFFHLSAGLQVALQLRGVRVCVCELLGRRMCGTEDSCKAQRFVLRTACKAARFYLLHATPSFICFLSCFAGHRA